MTPDVLSKLEDAFTNAFTDKMACLYAGISTTALYEYCNENPKFAERKEMLKETPSLVAQKTIVGSLGDVNNAWRWAERRMSDFKPKSSIEHSGAIASDAPQAAAAREVAEKYEKELRETIAAGHKKP